MSIQHLHCIGRTCQHHISIQDVADGRGQDDVSCGNVRKVREKGVSGVLLRGTPLSVSWEGRCMPQLLSGAALELNSKQRI